MKKFTALALALVMALGLLAGCGSPAPAGSTAAPAGSTGTGAPAAAFPEKGKNINMIVGYSAGGSTDIFARLVAKYVEQKWGCTVVVQNVTGGSGAVGFQQCLDSAADGYTVTISNGASLTLSESGNYDWTYKDFDNLAKIIDEDELLCVKADAPYNDLNEFVEYAKANPGKMTVGFAGLGGFTHLAAAKFIHDMGVEVNNIGYDSGSEAVTAVLGGFVDFCQQQPAETASTLESGDLKALAIMSTERHPSELLANVPTAKEQGVDFLVAQWRGISAPKGLPTEARTAWETCLAEIAADPAFQAEVESTLLSRVNCVTGQEFEDWMDSEAAWIGPLMDELGLKAS